NSPAGSSREGLADDVNIFDRILQNIAMFEQQNRNNCQFLICGDFNARIANLADYVEDDSVNHVDVLPDDYIEDVPMSRWSEDTGTNQFGPYLLDFCKQSGLRILNGRMGRNSGKCTYMTDRGKSVVDYIIASQSLFKYFDHLTVYDANILSDHCLLSFGLAATNEESKDNRNNENLQNIECKYVWQPARCDDFVRVINSEETVSKFDRLSDELSNLTGQNEIDENVKKFNTILDSVCSPLFKKNVFIGEKMSESCNKSENKWFDNNCMAARVEFYRCLNIYRNDKNDNTCKNMTLARTAFKNTVRKAKYDYTKQQTNILEEAKSKNAKEYWKMLKNTSCPKRASGLSADNFYAYFKAINNQGGHFFQPDEDIIYFNERIVENEFQVMFEELDHEISFDEINKAVKTLKNSKSGGPDLILNEFLKYGINSLRPYLHRLFNVILTTGVFPSCWGEGYIVPLFKKGDAENVENYRGITLLSVVGKLFTCILNNRLNEWAECYQVYIEAQAGFRSGMGTVDNIFVLHGLITHFINNNQKLFAAFVDFQKAFDYVVRDILWFKLVKFGVRGKMLTVIKSIYSNIKSRVKFENQVSRDFTCYLGVRQGECLSPILFSMYLNDIESDFIHKGAEGIDIGMFKLFLLLYADDIVIFANDKNNLQSSLDILQNYCTRWKLKVNSQKTKVMVFRKGGRLSENLHFYYDGNELEIVNKFVYLGITFTTGGSFHETQNSLAGKALKAIFKMNKYLYKFTDISIKHRLELFDKLIAPILGYSAEIWGFIKAPAIERVHLQFMKNILRVKTSPP
ncbi:MAG: reverse transcriptase family protein, partial [Candidatus Thiodiazotropha endolucinida]|nr:reverse transcriptase family protein [Candidatus Thiodiazotropha taylori]MCW4345721.1 reverse transcriptase family protein [Candidatus Thiodiazotropha endolucinida]